MNRETRKKEMDKKAIIQTKLLCKSYVSDGEVNHVIKNMNLEIERKDFTVIMGSSGSGKSTLLYAMSGMIDVTSGDVSFEEDRISALSEKKLAEFRRSKIGFVFQNFNLISDLTVTENIISPTYSSPLSKLDILESCETLLEKLEMKAHSKKFPNQLSGGQKQRVAICRALINKPQILFADEPTGALNSTQGQQVLDIFTKINQEGQGIVMVTHDLKAALRGNRILYLKDGRITGELKIEPYHEDRIEERELCVYNFLKENGF